MKVYELQELLENADQQADVMLMDTPYRGLPNFATLLAATNDENGTPWLRFDYFPKSRWSDLKPSEEVIEELQD